MATEPRLRPVPSLAELVEAPRRVLDLPADEAAALLERVAAVHALLLARVAASSTATVNGAGPDEMLTAKQAARRTGMSPRLLYKRARAGELPFAVRVSARSVRFSARGLDAWLSRRRGA